MDPILDQGNEEFGLPISSKAQDFLYEAGRWGKFLAIVGFVLIGFMVLGGIGFGLFMGSMMSTLGSEYGGASGMGLMSSGFFIFTFLASAVLYFFPNLYLYRFSTNAMAAVNQGNQAQIDRSLENLKSMLKFMGIFMIVILSFYALSILFSLVVGIAAI